MVIPIMIVILLKYKVDSDLLVLLGEVEGGHVFLEGIHHEALDLARARLGVEGQSGVGGGHCTTERLYFMNFQL